VQLELPKTVHSRCVALALFAASTAANRTAGSLQSPYEACTSLLGTTLDFRIVTMKQPGRAHLRPLEPFEAASPEAARLSGDLSISAFLPGAAAKSGTLSLLAI
jgi:hypothetical protein